MLGRLQLGVRIREACRSPLHILPSANFFLRKEDNMGAWDYGPFDNDDASDFWYTIRDAKNPMKALEKVLDNRNSGYENERRAAAAFVEFLLRFDRRSLQRLKKTALSAAKELRADDGYIREWSDEGAIKRELNKQIRKLSK